MSPDVAALLAAAAAAATAALLRADPGESRLAGRRPAGRPRWSRRWLPMRAGRGRHPTSVVDPEAVLALLDRLAALLRAGLGPRAVWEHLAAAPGPLRPVCAFVAESAAAGGSVDAALREAVQLLPAVGRRPADPSAAAVLGWLAVTTAVSDRCGAPAADCLDRLAAAVRAELATADERSAALAGPHATAQVLGWLPAAGVVLGALVGADPLRTLLLTGPGRACLAAGTLFWVGGRVWSRALVRAAERSGR